MTDLVRPRRSALYLPASNAKAMEKARSVDADVIIIDLEDAVSPDAKEAARDAAVTSIARGGYGRREVVLRVNGLDTPWGKEDLAAATASGADAVLVPKVNGAADIALYDEALREAPPGVELWAMVETSRSVFTLDSIAATAANSRLSVLVLGTNDLAKEMRLRPSRDRAPFLPILTMAVAAAAAHGLNVLDGVCNDFKDFELLRAECEQGVAFGMDGKTLIHPGQIALCNEIFSPSPQDLEWADDIIAAFALEENAGKGAISLKGKMVELLHLVEARRLRGVSDRIHADVG